MKSNLTSGLSADIEDFTRKPTEFVGIESGQVTWLCCHHGHFASLPMKEEDEQADHSIS